MFKVVYNDCYGGFSISKKCAERMAELGNQEAKERLQKYKEDWYGGLYATPRHDPVLVQVVEEMGEEANDRYSELKIKVLRFGNKYIIEEYDGEETVLEPEDKDIKWITI